MKLIYLVLIFVILCKVSPHVFVTLHLTDTKSFVINHNVKLYISDDLKLIGVTNPFRKTIEMKDYDEVMILKANMGSEVFYIKAQQLNVQILSPRAISQKAKEFIVD